MAHDDRPPHLLKYNHAAPLQFLLDLDQEECIRRRCCRDGSMPNPNPLSEQDCRTLLWPAHVRYLEKSVKPLGSRVTTLKAPANKVRICGDW